MLKPLTIFILIATLTSCLSLSDGDSDIFVKESSNKKQDKKAVLFSKSPSLSSDSYQVSIVGYDNKFNNTQVGNTFTVDNDHGKTRLDSASINFNWLSDDTLQIDYDKKIRTFIQQKIVKEVTIIYKAR
ncbi:hypothetical protein [Ferruginibacter profundus]